MVANNIFVTSTKMSLSDRFTILQSVRPVTFPQRHRTFSGMHSDKEADIRNRRLIERLALRPIAEAVSSMQRKPLRQRIGVLNNNPPKRNIFNSNRLNLPNRRPSMTKRTNKPANKNIRPLRKQRFLSRLNKYNFSQSDANFNPQNNFRNNNFRYVRNFRGKGQGRQINSDNNTQQNQRNLNFSRGRGTRRRGLSRGQIAIQNTSTEQNINNTNRGRGRNQKRGINRSWFSQKAPPTKEELDKQLDLYMAGTRSHLDKELDVYMSNAMDTE